MFGPIPPRFGFNGEKPAEFRPGELVGSRHAVIHQHPRRVIVFVSGRAEVQVTFRHRGGRITPDHVAHLNFGKAHRPIVRRGPAFCACFELREQRGGNKKPRR